MEIIRNYLEGMFSHLPNSEDVLKAKHELLQMMEDKYNELLSEGKTENEAIGTVISDFGNLDELAKDLGIDNYVNNNNSYTENILSLNEVKNFLTAQSHHAFHVALGVLLCIISVTGPILANAANLYSKSYNNKGIEMIGPIIMFVLIAAAVGIFIISGIYMEKWNYIKHNNYIIDYSTAKYVQDSKDHYRLTYAICLTIGIILCILCAVPSMIINSIFAFSEYSSDISGTFVFVFIGIGVFLIVSAGIRMGSYSKILKLNNSGTIGGNFVNSQKETIVYTSEFLNEFMPLYWKTTTCIYLIWSFLTFDWYITWVIWPVAAIIEALIKNIFKKN